mmetsp:Transcript_62336/g.174157  ORF Transcript_62336/g.174157 Transcript_62336/m.174157 type:complete len:313 (-) Transcript_62336:205-1143(-)
MANRTVFVAAVLLAASCLPACSGIEVRGAARERQQRVIQDLLLRSANISANIDALSHTASLDPTTRHLLASLRVCGRCEKFQRLGEDADGGYLTCMDGWEHGGVKAAFSMGVEHHDKWSQDMSRLLRGQGVGGTVVHQFDCTVSGGQQCPGCVFHPICIAPEGEEKPSYWGMSTVLKKTDLAAAKDRSLIMKMDIEAAEWPILAKERADVLRKFRQVILEFHGLNKEPNHKQYDVAVGALLGAGFRVVHIHGNNCCGMYSVPGSDYSVPRILEVTFASGSQPIQCQNRQTLHALDRDNIGKPPLPMAHLPGA